MFRAYANFSINHPYIHIANLLIVFGVFIMSCYQLLANNEVLYALGFVLVVFPTIIFAKASDYRRKYLSSNT